MFRDEIVEQMKQLTELKLSDLLSDEEFVGRMDELLHHYCHARNLTQREHTEPLQIIEQPEGPIAALFAVTVHGPEGQQRYEFNQRDITIGRSSDSDIVLRRTDISRRHARILVREDRFVVLDLKSENGTFMNGQRLGSPQVAHPSDQLNIGDYTLFVEPLW
ncbi:MAG: FHA domain-containing protein [Myxococcales bacterium]|nr:FHA domain-containing protein [Myxococcales bacterium]